MLSIFTAPKGIIPKHWQPSDASLLLLLPGLHLIDELSWGEAEVQILDDLHNTDLKSLIPKNPTASGQSVSATWLDRATAVSAHSALYAGPWAAFYPDVIEMLSSTIGEALDNEADMLLIVRE